jgi:hypothetical protein
MAQFKNRLLEVWPNWSEDAPLGLSPLLPIENAPWLL